jgi:hypothetical protein
VWRVPQLDEDSSATPHTMKEVSPTLVTKMGSRYD